MPIQIRVIYVPTSCYLFCWLQLELDERYKTTDHEKPKLTYVIVTKKINTRAFTIKQQAYDNPPPGSVMDTVVTIPER